MPEIAATAADCLFGLLGMDPDPDPSVSSAKNHVPLLIWGGGSEVGHTIIQFAREAGVAPIIVFASPAHHVQLQYLGAARCFGHHKAIDEHRTEVTLALSQLCPGRRLRLAIDASGMNHNEIQAILADSESDLNLQIECVGRWVLMKTAYLELCRRWEALVVSLNLLWR